MDQRQNRLDLRQRLFDLIKERSFRRGTFTLASGKESAYYFDSKPTMLHPEGAAELYAAAGVPFRSLFRAEEFLRD